MSAFFKKAFAVFIAIFTAISSFFTAGINAKKHDLTVELSSNPSTGCSWELVIDNEDVIKCSDRKYKDPVNIWGAAGKSGTETFYFDAVSDGKATITLTYGQQWKEDGIFRTVVYECESKDSKITVLNVVDSDINK